MDQSPFMVQEEFGMSHVQEKRIVCIFHANCLDGVASAWVVEQFFGKDVVEFIPGIYGRPAPELEDCEVYVVDFSYAREQMLKLMENNKVVVLDHHETAAKELDGLHHIDQAHSGAMVTWNYFFGKNATPPVQLLYVQDRDLFKFELEHTKAWTLSAFSYPVDLENFREHMGRDPASMIADGEVLTRKEQSDIGKLLANKRMMVIDGVEVPVVNCPYMYASEIGAVLAKEHYYSVTYCDESNGRKFSLRARKDDPTAALVNIIAESFGGGGHDKAAGFSIRYEDPRFATSHLFLDSGKEEEAIVLDSMEAFGAQAQMNLAHGGSIKINVPAGYTNIPALIERLQQVFIETTEEMKSGV